jgi:hypothetical protein
MAHTCPNPMNHAEKPQRAMRAEEAKIISEAWANDAKVCTHCGCVHTEGPDGPVLRGYIQGAWWVPEKGAL